MKRIIALIISYFCIVSLAQADESWTRFRGPNGSGVSASSKLPIRFGNGQNEVWKTSLPAGHSSPVIWDKKIFLTAAEAKDLLTICVDLESGKELWRKVAPRDRTEKLDFRNHPAAASPVVDADNVYVFFGDYGLIAYTHDGELQWTKQLGPFNNLYGMGASPILVGDLVVLACDQNLGSFVIALDRKSGKQVWKTPRPYATSGHCSPILFHPPGQPPQIIVAGSFYLTAYDSRDGKRIWWVKGLCFEMKSTPVILDGVLFIHGFGSPQNQIDQEFEIKTFEAVLASSDKNGDKVLSSAEMPDDLSRNFFPAVDLDNNQSLNEKEWNYFRESIASKNSMLAIRLGGSGDMTKTSLLWKYHQNIPQLPSPITFDDQLLMISDRGIVTSLNPKTGEPRFKGRLQGASGSVYSSPVSAAGIVYFTTLGGKIAVVDPAEELKVLAVNDLKAKCYATPAILNDKIFVRTEKALHCFGIGKTDEKN